MATSVQISGFDKNGFFNCVSVELKKTITDTESLLFVASTPTEFQKIDEYSQRIFGFFHDIGLNFNSYRVIDKRMPDGEQENAVKKASCLFLMGGYARVQLKYLNEQNLVSSIINHKGVVIGLSAGAINMAKRSVIANPYYPPVSVYNGMGLVNITVIPHFDITKEEFIKNEVLPLTYEETIYGICDDAIIVTQDGVSRCNGTIYKLAQGTVELFTKREII